MNGSEISQYCIIWQ